ncbi:MAG TPA: hypothetical protein VHX88_21935 [Solirubrobacteraceae bacterium]|jgi:hypothetical protein|nr:hypothetical protein [Solirubrobacteraceae bacterium]
MFRATRKIVLLSLTLSLVGATPALADATLTADSVQATEGQSATFALGTFTDNTLLSGCNPASDYAATIDWGDGAPDSAGTVALTGGSGGLFSNCDYAVAGSHTFPLAGQYTIVVNLSPPGGEADTSADTSAVVADLPPRGIPAGTLQATVGQPLSTRLAKFSDGDPYEQASDYHASVNWGDGSAPQSATVSDVPGGGFQVTGAHTYSSAGEEPLTVDVSDQDGESTGTMKDDVSVLGSDPTVSLAALHTTVGQETAFSLGGFTDEAGLLGNCNAASAYAASVSWGDGTASSPATVTATGGGGLPFAPCTYTLAASHAYARAGNETVSVTVTPPAPGGASSASTTATVADTPINAVAGAARSATVGQPLTAVLATFTDSNAYATVSDFTATVNWGDGSAPHPATVSAVSGGGFQVTGSHTFSAVGNDVATITVADQAGTLSRAVQVPIEVLARPSSPGPGTGESPTTPPGSEPASTLHLSVGPASLLGVRALRVRVSCPASVRQCRGTLRATLRSIHGTALPATLFFLNGGRTATLDMLIPAAAQHALSRAHSVTVILTAATYDTLGRRALRRTVVTATLRRR